MSTPTVIDAATRALYQHAYALSVALDDTIYELPRDIDMVVSTARTATDVFKLNYLLLRQFRDAVPRPSAAKAMRAPQHCYLRVIRARSTTPASTPGTHGWQAATSHSKPAFYRPAWAARQHPHQPHSATDVTPYAKASHPPAGCDSAQGGWSEALAGVGAPRGPRPWVLIEASIP